MNKIDIYITSIVLFYRERQLSKDPSVSSKDLIRNVINIDKKKRELISLDGDIATPDQDVKRIIERMLESPETYEESTVLLPELKSAFKTNLSYYDNIKEQIENEMTNAGLKRSVNALKLKLHKYYQSITALHIVNRLSYNLNNNRVNKSIQSDIMEILPELESLCRNSNLKDPGLINTLVLSSTDDVDKMISKIKRERNENGVLKTGWKQLNTCIQGGLRRGEMVMIDALQHNYKSGFVQSLIMQIARHNKPQMLDTSKKPMLLYISLEDELHNVLKFMYKYLYYNENRQLPDGTEDDISLLSTESLQKYVMDRLGVNGYEVVLVRGDPGQWSYHNIFNLVNEYEANGYEIHCCVIDYLAKLPTTGCDNTGPQGTGMRDLFNRIRNFFSTREISVVTPHQISVDGKILTRNGVQESTFVKEIANKGYTEGSKQLDQVVDLELYLHKAKINNRWHLTVQRGKHRGQEIIDDKLLYFVLPFPNQAPILENINDSGDENGEGLEEDDVFNI